MRFIPTPIDGAFLVELDLRRDERGAFGRTFCEEAFRLAGAPMTVVQANISLTSKAATLRGMHYQAPPHQEPKLVQCVRGRIFDVAIDVRYQSSTYGRIASVELTGGGDHLFFIPAGCAHGFLTLEDDSDVLYYMGAAYAPEAARGVRWNDPAFAIPWPMTPKIISDRDANYVDLQQQGPHRR
jgi:dTDP-4-dehydrorhamnose 3,5-epimerase